MAYTKTLSFFMSIWEKGVFLHNVGSESRIQFIMLGQFYLMNLKHLGEKVKISYMWHPTQNWQEYSKCCYVHSYLATTHQHGTYCSIEFTYEIMISFFLALLVTMDGQIYISINVYTTLLSFYVLSRRCKVASRESVVVIIISAVEWAMSQSVVAS